MYVYVRVRTRARKSSRDCIESDDDVVEPEVEKEKTQSLIEAPLPARQVPSPRPWSEVRLLPPSLPPSLSLCTLRCRYSQRRTRRRVASGSRTLTSAGPPSSPVWHRRSPLTKETRWGRGRGRGTSGNTCAPEEARQCHVQAKLINS